MRPSSVSKGWFNFDSIGILFEKWFRVIVYERKGDLPLICLQEAEDHAGGRYSVHLYQHAFQSHGSQHPTRHQGAAGAYAGCWPQVGQNGFTTMLNGSANKVLALPGWIFGLGLYKKQGLNPEFDLYVLYSYF